MKTGKNDHPGYSCERAQWALVTGVGPLNFAGRDRRFCGGFRYSFNSWLMSWLKHTKAFGFVNN